MTLAKIFLWGLYTCNNTLDKQNDYIAHIQIETFLRYICLLNIKQDGHLFHFTFTLASNYHWFLYSNGFISQAIVCFWKTCTLQVRLLTLVFQFLLKTLFGLQMGTYMLCPHMSYSVPTNPSVSSSFIRIPVMLDLGAIHLTS